MRPPGQALQSSRSPKRQFYGRPVCGTITSAYYVPIVEERINQMTTQLEHFLNEPVNMHAREALLMHRLSYDIKLAAARRGYYLNSYFDDVDHDGFDIILDDQDYIKKIQVKSVGAKNTTQSWKIHKKILRPSIYLLDKLGLETSPESEGTEGGVVLIEYKDTNDKLDIVYHYTDVFILLAFECGIIQRTDGRSQKAVNTCLAGLLAGLGSEKVSVPIAAFIQSKSVESLLSLMGLHSSVSSGWKHNVIRVANHTRQLADRSLSLPTMPLDKFIQFTASEILGLTDDPTVHVKPAV